MKLEDIAKLAGVSISSVSLALNNRPGISEKTRQKILDIVKKNNYIPPKKFKPEYKKSPHYGRSTRTLQSGLLLQYFQ